MLKLIIIYCILCLPAFAAGAGAYHLCKLGLKNDALFFTLIAIYIAGGSYNML